MARYIDAELLDETIDKYQNELESNITSIWYKNKPLYKGLAYLRGIIREEIPTADVAPKSEVAIEIFAKLREGFYKEGMKLNNKLSKAIRENNPIEENTLFALASGVRAASRIIADCEAKYIAGANESEILYGGPREGGKKHAEKETTCLMTKNLTRNGRRQARMSKEQAKNDIEIKREICEILREIRACVPHPIRPDQEKYVKLADVEVIFKRHVDKLDARIRERLRERGE